MKSKLAIISLILVLLGILVFSSIFISPGIQGILEDYLPFIFDFPEVVFNSLYLFVAGFITSIISLVLIKKYKLSGKWLAIVSLIISLLFILYLVLALYELITNPPDMMPFI